MKRMKKMTLSFKISDKGNNLPRHLFSMGIQVLHTIDFARVANFTKMLILITAKIAIFASNSTIIIVFSSASASEEAT